MQEGPRYLQPRTLQRVGYQPSREENSICLIVRKMTAAWRLRISADSRHEMSGRAYLGSVRVLPWPSGGDRIVALACAPGARSWYVDGEPESSAVTENPEVDFMGSPYLTAPGVSPIPGVSLPLARHISSLSGVAGAVAPPGPVVGYSCIAGPTGATVAFIQNGTTTTVIVPPGASFSDDFGGSAGLYDTLTFAGSLSYTVDSIVPGDGLDAY